MQTAKKYSGFVQPCPAAQNPEHLKFRFAFLGFPEGAPAPRKQYTAVLDVIDGAGTVSVDTFAADVAQMSNSLPGELELYPPGFSLGKFRYIRPATGQSAAADANDVREINPPDLAPKKETPRVSRPAVPNPVRQPAPPEPDFGPSF